MSKRSSPKIKSYPECKFVSFCSFVISETGEFFTMKSDWFNYETTITCIREFPATHPIKKNGYLYIGRTILLGIKDNTLHQWRQSVYRHQRKCDDDLPSIHFQAIPLNLKMAPQIYGKLLSTFDWLKIYFRDYFTIVLCHVHVLSKSIQTLKRRK